MRSLGQCFISQRKRYPRCAQKRGLLERVHLIAFPPYAPDENPIEHVWNDAKDKIANFQRETFAETKSAFVSHITGRKFKYKI